MRDESLADVVVLAAEIARICLVRITSTTERVPKSLSELVEALAVAARGEQGEQGEVDLGHLRSLGDAAIDLSQRGSMEERALVDALGATAYAVDAALFWETSRSPDKRDQACASLLRAVRGASSSVDIAAAVMAAIGRIDVRLRVLGEALQAAVRASFEEVRAAHPSERLLGYALCTDDSVTTLSAIACTAESLAKSRAPAARWLPVEWPYADSGQRFALVRELLEASYRARGRDGFDAHVELAFAVCVASLGELRARRSIDDDVLLVAVSTDPGPPFLEWAVAGAATLNSPEVAEGFRSAVGG